MRPLDLRSYKDRSNVKFSIVNEVDFVHFVIKFTFINIVVVARFKSLKISILEFKRSSNVEIGLTVQNYMVSFKLSCQLSSRKNGNAILPLRESSATNVAE